MEERTMDPYKYIGYVSLIGEINQLTNYSYDQFHGHLGGDFIFLFSTLPGEMIHFD